MTVTELMPNQGLGNTEPSGSKLKKGKGKRKPNFERGPSWLVWYVAISNGKVLIAPRTRYLYSKQRG